MRGRPGIARRGAPRGAPRLISPRLLAPRVLAPRLLAPQILCPAGNARRGNAGARRRRACRRRSSPAAKEKGRPPEIFAGEEDKDRPPEVLAGEGGVARRAEEKGRPPEVFAGEQEKGRGPEVLAGEEEKGRGPGAGDPRRAGEEGVAGRAEEEGRPPEPEVLAVARPKRRAGRRRSSGPRRRGRGKEVGLSAASRAPNSCVLTPCVAAAPISKLRTRQHIADGDTPVVGALSAVISRLVYATIKVSRILVCGVDVSITNGSAEGTERGPTAECDARAARAARCASAKLADKQSKGGENCSDNHHHGDIDFKGEHDLPNNNTIRSSASYLRYYSCWALYATRIDRRKT